MADTPAEEAAGRVAAQERVGTPVPAVGLVPVAGCQQTLHRNTLCMELLHRYLDKKKSMPAPVHG